MPASRWKRLEWSRSDQTVCESERFDALLSDVVMPLVNGHELVRLTMRRNREYVVS